MQKCLVDFAKMEWERPAAGDRFKAFVNGNQRMRLVEFSEGFVEPDWCTKGHAGMVLDGSFTLEYKKGSERFCKGDFLFIPEGEKYGHKAVLAVGEKVLLLLFEIV